MLNGLTAEGTGRKEGRQPCYLSNAHPQESKSESDWTSLQPQLVPYVHHTWHTGTTCDMDLVKAQEMGLKFFQIFSYAVLPFGDIPADCIARVVGHDQTILYERSSEVAPSAPAIHAEFRVSGDRLLDQDQQQKGLDFIESCVTFVLQSPYLDELTKELRQSQQTDMEMYKRTAEFFTKQGNTDITELMIIGAMAQSEHLFQTILFKRTVLLQMWINSSRVASGDEGPIERDDKTGNDSLDQFMRDPSIQKAKNMKPRSIISEKHEIRKLCRETGESRRLPQENRRTHALESRDQDASGQKTHKTTPQQRQAQPGNQRHTVQTTAGRSNTIPTRQHPELGQAHRARIDFDSTPWAAVSTSRKFLFTSTIITIAESVFNIIRTRSRLRSAR